MTSTTRQIEKHLEEASRQLVQAQLEALAAIGIRKDAIVKVPGRYWRPGFYRIDTVEVSFNRFASPIYASFWVYGHKLRKDGTWGNFRHSLCPPSEIVLASEDEIRRLAA